MGKLKYRSSTANLLSIFQRRELMRDEFEKIKIEKKKQEKLPIRFPWEKSERHELQEKKAAIEKNPDAFKGGRLMRTKFPEKHHRKCATISTFTRICIIIVFFQTFLNSLHHMAFHMNSYHGRSGISFSWAGIC